MSKTDAGLAAATFIALAGGWWLMDDWIAIQGWTVWTGGKWGIPASGWRMLGQAWPVALAGAVLGATLAATALWPALVHAGAGRSRAETALAGQQAGLERQRLALEQKRQAIEREQTDAQARLETQQCELNLAHARRLAETEAGRTKAQATEINARIAAEEEARQARAETAEAKARADMLQKRLESEEKRRKNAVAASTRLRLKHRPERPRTA
jgi:hypothetical protein